MTGLNLERRFELRGQIRRTRTPTTAHNARPAQPFSELVFLLLREWLDKLQQTFEDKTQVVPLPAVSRRLNRGLA